MQPMPCMYCQEDLIPLSISQRQVHYDQHLNVGYEHVVEGSPMKPIVIDDNSLETSPTKSKKRSDSATASSRKNGHKKIMMFPCQRETDDFWYPAQATTPPPSFTPGLIYVLKKGIAKGHTKGLIRKAALCYGDAVHVSRESWDANWGCGYRNFLMACAGLMSQTKQPLYFPLLDSPLPPSIRNLQQWIESAWKEGYDPEGQQELKKLINTTKWIGTADLWVAFTFRGIPAELVDFNYESKGQAKASELVIDWVVNYFTPNSPSSKPSNAFESMKMTPIAMTDKMPLILQHNGHSRTVVGYEIDKNGATNLLVFDPSFRPDSTIRNAALAEFAASGQQASSTLTATSSLKRKRSVVSVQDENVQDGNSSAKRTTSTSKPLTPPKDAGQKGKGKAREGQEMDTFRLVKKFRLDPKSLSKKKQYQILYFPMTAPLTDYEKGQKKQVRSTKIS
ncbi:DUF1671-domain-containing protein [Agrocybe pediades]|nr:DUF1671-domain-containing protein [Agrocybe pediades]